MSFHPVAPKVMAWLPFNLRTEKYQALNDPDDINNSDRPTKRKGYSGKGPFIPHWKSLFAGIFLGLVIAVILFFAGLRLLSQGDKGYLTPPGSKPKNLVFNSTFVQPPSVESDAAWDSIVPEGLGFVKHPSLGPDIVSLAFVHQLHCINTLRHTYYTALNGDADRHTTIHAEHCIDYLRQITICNADPNPEHTQPNPLDPNAVVVASGWGEHQCRDYDKIFQFAEKWRTREGKTIDLVLVD